MKFDQPSEIPPGDQRPKARAFECSALTLSTEGQTSVKEIACKNAYSFSHFKWFLKILVVQKSSQGFDSLIFHFYSHMKVNCSYGYESFTAGGSAVALLTCDGVDIDSKITAQACGHVCIDTRWSGSTGVMANNFAQTSLYPVDASIQIPKLQTARDNVAFCIFLTPKIVFPLSFSKGEAILIYFDIPIDSLPTFRGLCAYISYAINLHVITTDGTTKQLSLPFTVKGCGCASVPYSIRWERE